MSKKSASSTSHNNQAQDAVKPGQKNVLLFTFVTIILLIMVIFSILEITFRITGLFEPTLYQLSATPGLEFELRPDATFKVDGVRRRLNNFGFFDHDFHETKEKGSLRVVCLGDSMTNAISLPPESNYVKLLEKRIGAEYPDRKTEFFNMGVGGYNTMQEWLVYDFKARKLNPDIVIVQFLLNDLTYSHPVDGNPALVPRIKRFFSRRFYTYQFIKFLKLRIKGDLNSSQRDFETADPLNAPVSADFMRPAYDPQGALFQNWKDAVSRFGALNKSGTRVLFVIFPWTIYQGLHDNKPYPYFEFHDQVIKVLEAEGIPYVDVTLPLMEKANLLDYWVKPTDFHLNAEAHKIIADTLTPEIISIVNNK